jgi:glycosyltransferase involved in cell wall biosynthesis
MSEKPGSSRDRRAADPIERVTPVARRLRILYAHCFYRTPGGEDRHVRDQVALVSRVHDVELLAEANLDLSRTPLTAARMAYSPKKTREVLAVIDRFAPDILHLHNAYPSLGAAAVLAARERSIPLVMTVHNFRLRCPNGLMFTENAVCRRCQSGAYVNAIVHRCFPTRAQAGAYAAALWVHRFLMRLDEQVAAFVVPSEFVRGRLLEWGIDASRIRMVRHFVSPSDFTEVATPSGSYGAFAGRLSSEKGLHVLLRALRRAGDPRFSLIGDGPQRASLEAMARDLALTNTTFHGWRRPDEVRALIREARYVAVPSVWEETASLAALEALAAGRPLLVSNRGALPELVATGAGLHSRPGDEIDMAEKIRQLVNDEALCRQASSRAREFARRWLAPDRHLADLDSLYQELSVGSAA